MIANNLNVIAFKKKRIVGWLSKSVGLVIRGKDCMVVITKAKYVFELQKNPIKDKYVFLWAICGSSENTHDFNVEFQCFWSSFVEKFSARDFNIDVLRDFVSNYLRYEFYSKSAIPIALEFILGGISNKNMIFHTLNHEGRSSSIGGNASKVGLIGGGDKVTQNKLIKNLAELNTENLSAKEIIKKVGPYLDEYSGDFDTYSFVVTSVKGSRTKCQKKKIKKRR